MKRIWFSLSLVLCLCGCDDELSVLEKSSYFKQLRQEFSETRRTERPAEFIVAGRIAAAGAKGWTIASPQVLLTRRCNPELGKFPAFAPLPLFFTQEAAPQPGELWLFRVNDGARTCSEAATVRENTLFRYQSTASEKLKNSLERGDFAGILHFQKTNDGAWTVETAPHGRQKLAPGTVLTFPDHHASIQMRYHGETQEGLVFLVEETFDARAFGGDVTTATYPATLPKRTDLDYPVIQTLPAPDGGNVIQIHGAKMETAGKTKFYPTAAEILTADGKTRQRLRALHGAGCTTAAEFTDVDFDGVPDLLIHENCGTNHTRKVFLFLPESGLFSQSALLSRRMSGVSFQVFPKDRRIQVLRETENGARISEFYLAPDRRLYDATDRARQLDIQWKHSEQGKKSAPPKQSGATGI